MTKSEAESNLVKQRNDATRAIQSLDTANVISHLASYVSAREKVSLEKPQKPGYIPPMERFFPFHILSKVHLSRNAVSSEEDTASKFLMVAQTLAESGRRAEAEIKEGDTPLHTVIRRYHKPGFNTSQLDLKIGDIFEPYVKFLIAHIPAEKIDFPDGEGNTALLLAARNRLPESVIRDLLDKGASPEKPNTEGVIPAAYIRQFYPLITLPDTKKTVKKLEQTLQSESVHIRSGIKPDVYFIETTRTPTASKDEIGALHTLQAQITTGVQHKYGQQNVRVQGGKRGILEVTFNKEAGEAFRTLLRSINKEIAI